MSVIVFLLLTRQLLKVECHESFILQLATLSWRIWACLGEILWSVDWSASPVPCFKSFCFSRYRNNRDDSFSLSQHTWQYMASIHGFWRRFHFPLGRNSALKSIFSLLFRISIIWNWWDLWWSCTLEAFLIRPFDPIASSHLLVTWAWSVGYK